jgi:hypothetical protein
LVFRSAALRSVLNSLTTRSIFASSSASGQLVVEQIVGCERELCFIGIGRALEQTAYRHRSRVPCRDPLFVELVEPFDDRLRGASRSQDLMPPLPENSGWKRASSAFAGRRRRDRSPRVAGRPPVTRSEPVLLSRLLLPSGSSSSIGQDQNNGEYQ